MASLAYTERIRQARPTLSKSFKRLADYILDSYIQAALMTASELAHQVNVDAATVVRFAQALDYSGFPQLQDEIKDRVLTDLHLGDREAPEADSVEGMMVRSFQGFTQSLERTRKLLDYQAAASLMAMIQDAGQVVFVSRGRYSGLVHHFMGELGKFGILGKGLNLESDVLASSLAVLGEGDLVVVLDMDGESRLFGATLDQAKKFSIPSAAMVAGASFEAARKADMVLELHTGETDESEFLLLSAMFESVLNLLRLRLGSKYSEFEDRAKKARRTLADKV